MSTVTAFDSSVSGGIDCELSVSIHHSEELEYQQSTCHNMKEIVNAGLEDFGKSSASEELVVVVQTGLACGNVENFQECKCHEHIPPPCSLPNQDNTSIASEITICHEFTQSVSLDANVRKTLNKCKAVPLMKEMHIHPLSPGYNEFDISMQDQDSTASGSMACARSMSFSAPTIISAMKGSRAQNRAAVKSELCVKWAPDVYDPPVSIVSHTVKAHNNQRLKSKKKDKYRHKGKSSRGNGSEKKHGNHKTPYKIPEPLNVRLHGDGDRQALDGFDILEYSINSSKEAKCGSSFLREALEKVHLSMGEAS